jgi:hypothetical protein
MSDCRARIAKELPKRAKDLGSAATIVSLASVRMVWLLVRRGCEPYARCACTRVRTRFTN